MRGVLAGSVLGTRLHGPLLALNPELADLVLARALGRDEPWPTLESPAIERARRERIAEVRRDIPRRAGATGCLPRGTSAARLILAGRHAPTDDRCSARLASRCRGRRVAGWRDQRSPVG